MIPAASRHDSGVASTSTRPAATAAQMASTVGGASMREKVDPSCRSRCTSPLPTIGLPCWRAHATARRLKFSDAVNIALYSTASNRSAWRSSWPQRHVGAGKKACGAITRPPGS